MSIRGVQDGSRSPRIVTDSFFDDEVLLSSDVFKQLSGTD
ncbi:hypothetical protein RR46_13336 [Papilio xuthus]|uniref:Uncharacterized protein n=1 Tax=Papilio xuthus TaxID=66420 RepID=A0A194PLY4_PAPXU|nr:hypothetical protein RR46_13336 [Papilio xuthus]